MLLDVKSLTLLPVQMPQTPAHQGAQPHLLSRRGSSCSPAVYSLGTEPRVSELAGWELPWVLSPGHGLLPWNVRVSTGACLLGFNSSLFMEAGTILGVEVPLFRLLGWELRDRQTDRLAGAAARDLSSVAASVREP